MQIVQINGHAFHVAQSGDPAGPAVVFANSLGTDLRVWDAVLPQLLPGLRIIRYDKRGHGLSDAPDGTWRIEDFADDLAGILDALGATRVAMVGLSVGGLIAQALASRRPDLVRVLILSGTAAKIGTADLWNARIRAVEADGIASIADPILERWFSAEFRARNPELALWRNMLNRTPAAAYAATCGAIRDADLTEGTRALSLPTLALVGDQDGSTPPDLVRATAALIPGARCEVIADAGHLPGVEQPEAVATLIADFLKETGHV
jgi:3-oxoadipate enol-lactonase